jgi:hypothetical protein
MKLKRTLCILGILTLGITIGGCSKTPQVTRVDPFDESIKKAFTALSEQVDSASVSVLPIAATDAKEGEYVRNCLTGLFGTSGKYSIAKKGKAEGEFDFQVEIVEEVEVVEFKGTDMIDDTIAVTMGGIAGAQVVIVGAIQGEGKSKRLMLRALDVKTSAILGMASESL